jgi:outer membrane lipoprotein SlyB
MMRVRQRLGRWEAIMRCSNCGKDVPLLGKVCPWCHVDKSKDQAITLVSGAGAIGGGFVGNMIDGFMGMLIGAVIGAVLMAIAAAVKLKALKK